MAPSATARALLDAARELADAVDAMAFPAPVTHVYNPLRYAWAGQAAYLQRFGAGKKRYVFMGINPGPFGMAQTGVPFGSIPAVRDWMGIEVPVESPPATHPKRPIEGFACPKVEVSGRRLWMELIAPRFATAGDFFAEGFITNYCPLVFMIASGANFTPDKFPVAVRRPLEAACDHHLRRVLEILAPEWAIGVGNYAEKNFERVVTGLSHPPKVTRIIHPAPASPLANREWPENPRRALEAAGIW